MTVFKVLGSLQIGDNTAVVVDGKGDSFYNGVGILDEKGIPHEVLSVGMDYCFDFEDMFHKTSLLVEGDFTSEKLYL